MKISRKIDEPKWYKLNKNTEFQIRPFPFSSQTAIEIMAMMLEQFKYCVMDWKGVLDEDGKTKLAVNDENKTFLYDYYPDIRDFVISNARSVADKSLKN